MERLVRKFRNAIEGLIYAFRIDNGVKIQFLLALLTIIACLFLNLLFIEWLIIIVCIGAVLSAELLNTAIEKTLDHVVPPSHHVKVIKDISAAGVLVISVAAFIVMGLILISKGGF